ncbi:MAG TPA: FAD-binding oxidoreductase [Candidatus Saccharimonadales bacterium]|nr:FAD-binding oxidoreductase [Candidatus Saccharimonadales bacterium]
MNELLPQLRAIFDGELTDDIRVRNKYSHDASIYELTPDVVAHPTSVDDIKQLVRFVAENKQLHPTLSIVPRGAGTDMSGGAIGSSVLIDMTTHFNTIESVTKEHLHVQPGVYMRDVDPLLAEHGVMLGCVPASRALCTLGGMVGNNSGGEQSLRFGNTERFVKQLKVVLADGNEYVVEPLTKNQLDKKMAENTFEAALYRGVFELIEDNYDLIHNARPKVNKNSMGYNLWSVWDRATGIFDMTHLITGSQGTLGIVTDITFKVVPAPKHTGLLVLYLRNTKNLGEIIPKVMEHHPATFEGFDDITFELGIRHFSLFRKQLGAKEWLKQQASLLSSVATFKGHLPNMVLMVEFEGDTQEEVGGKIETLRRDLTPFKLRTEVAGNEELSQKFWQIRRASLSLLRQRIKDKYASPFIDDLAVQPKHLPQFLPELRKIIRRYKLPATIAGHFGDGNFHIIPLMSIEGTADQAKLEPVMREVVPLVLRYGGTMAGEHNDGMVRGPWLPAVFGEEVYQIFRETKELFDPSYIFNPHKKTDADWEFSMEHIRTHSNGGLIK